MAKQLFIPPDSNPMLLPFRTAYSVTGNVHANQQRITTDGSIRVTTDGSIRVTTDWWLLTSYGYLLPVIPPLLLPPG